MIGTCGNERICYKVFNVVPTPRNDSLYTSQYTISEEEQNEGSRIYNDAIDSLETDEALDIFEHRTSDPIPNLMDSSAQPLIETLNMTDYDYIDANGGKNDSNNTFKNDSNNTFKNDSNNTFKNDSILMPLLGLQNKTHILPMHFLFDSSNESFFSEESNAFFEHANMSFLYTTLAPKLHRKNATKYSQN